MSYIAESAGGFAFIGRNGKLYIRTIYQDEQEIPLELFGDYKWGDKCTITKVSYENGAESFKFGNDTGNNLWLNQDNMYIVEENQVEDIYIQVKDLEAHSFEGRVIIDPALDVGDKLIIDGKSVIYQGEADFQTRFIAEINSKISIKQKQETTVRKQSQKNVNRRVQSTIDEIEGKIEQIIQETDENTEKTQSKSQVDSSFDDSGERVLHHDDDAHSDNSVLHASVSEQLNTDTSFEMSQSQSRLRVDTTDIIRQIVDSMSISNTTEESAINLQLTPESLGRMYINVSQKNSEISARIAVSNEAVKEALQTQMVNLKEALNNSGIRVNEVEITVASHEFERNLEQGAANDSRQQESTNSYNGSNSSDSGIDSDMMQDRAEERLVTQIMRDNGNSVDFTA